MFLKRPFLFIFFGLPVYRIYVSKTAGDFVSLIGYVCFEYWQCNLRRMERFSFL